jgi:hypothetical protein
MRLPVPEVFAWVHNNVEVSIYMVSMEGDNAEDRWPGMEEYERQAV